MQSKQQLGFFSLTMIVISLVIGMGIFKTPAVIAAKSGTSTIFYAAWAIGGFIALCGALTYAEIGLRLPVVGGYYKVFAHAYHPSIGFTINALILISNAASLAVVALIGADYAADLWFGKEGSATFNILVAIVPICLFYLVNLSGLKTSSRTQNVLTIIKISLVVLLISSFLKDVNIPPHGYTPKATTYTYNGSNGLLLLMLSLVAVSFTYGGYQQTINFGGEIKNTRIMQRGIIIGMVVVIILYLSISYAYVQVIGFDNMKNATAIGALLCEVWFGSTGGKVFDFCMFLSVMAYVNVLLMSNPRVMYAMSEDKVFPAIFSKKNKKTQVLVPGLTLFAAIAIVITFFGKEVDDVLSFSIFLDCFGMSLSAATLLILRKQKTGEANVGKGFAKNITPILCVLFVIAYAVVAVAVVIDKPKAALTGVVLMAIFMGIYFIVYHKKRVVR
ncbi:MAG: APC family permease [Chitinophagaceae bacterium]|nr:APC family permease [Chitinophagaceae bacterium]MBP9739482.1 APC family permease [Chitinophagaceae bacterium]